jgi:hypothetical protein
MIAASLNDLRELAAEALDRLSSQHEPHSPPKTLAHQGEITAVDPIQGFYSRRFKFEINNFSRQIPRNSEKN